ncbi:hypothetical protein RB195_014700 [Necator americanus]|uniref:Secreted protein n=1 Tax=Necator americanus TaxID=51031 RepID=A0ABR1E1A0_NECAM
MFPSSSILIAIFIGGSAATVEVPMMDNQFMKRKKDVRSRTVAMSQVISHAQRTKQQRLYQLLPQPQVEVVQRQEQELLQEELDAHVSTATNSHSVYTSYCVFFL